MERSSSFDRCFETLVQEHSVRLKRMIQGRMGPALRRRIDAEDVLQETLRVAAERFDVYRRDKAVSSYVWLRGLARERLIDLSRKHLRAQKRDVRREWSPQVWEHESSLDLSAICLGIDPSPGSSVIRAEQNELLHAAIASLDARDRAVVTLRFFERMSISEVAEILDVQPGHVKILQYRALQKLGKKLDDSRSS